MVDPVSVLERNRNPTFPLQLLLRDRRLHFAHIETNRRIGAKRALLSSAAGPGGELAAPGQVAGLGGAPPKTDTAVSDRIF